MKKGWIWTVRLLQSLVYFHLRELLHQSSGQCIVAIVDGYRQSNHYDRSLSISIIKVETGSFMLAFTKAVIVASTESMTPVANEHEADEVVNNSNSLIPLPTHILRHCLSFLGSSDNYYFLAALASNCMKRIGILQLRASLLQCRCTIMFQFYSTKTQI